MEEIRAFWIQSHCMTVAAAVLFTSRSAGANKKLELQEKNKNQGVLVVRCFGSTSIVLGK
jgi:hypothetical protein